jgi:uncharacterized protein
VHPEAYPVAKRVLADISKGMKIDPTKYIDEKFGLPTVQDILRELEKPGRDPRPEFKTASFREGVEELKDLEPGMMLEGVVTNVTNFGAFVDIGVHQDGLVHVSALSEKFVKDPHTVVKAGDLVKVKVLEVDVARKRIALSMRMSDTPTPREKVSHGVTGGNPRGSTPNRQNSRPAPRREPEPAGAMANAFAKLKR